MSEFARDTHPGSHPQRAPAGRRIARDLRAAGSDTQLSSNVMKVNEIFVDIEGRTFIIA